MICSQPCQVSLGYFLMLEGKWQIGEGQRGMNYSSPGQPLIAGSELEMAC